MWIVSLHLSDLVWDSKEYIEDYVQQFIPGNKVVDHSLDVSDLEEQRR